MIVSSTTMQSSVFPIHSRPSAGFLLVLQVLVDYVPGTGLGLGSFLRASCAPAGRSFGSGGLISHRCLFIILSQPMDTSPRCFILFRCADSSHVQYVTPCVGDDSFTASHRVSATQSTGPARSSRARRVFIVRHVRSFDPTEAVSQVHHSVNPTHPRQSVPAHAA